VRPAVSLANDVVPDATLRSRALAALAALRGVEDAHPHLREDARDLSARLTVLATEDHPSRDVAVERARLAYVAFLSWTKRVPSLDAAAYDAVATTLDGIAGSVGLDLDSVTAERLWRDFASGGSAQDASDEDA
jgi:hypothetical protein